MYQNEQPTGTEPENNQFANNNGSEYQNSYTGNSYNGNNYTGNNYNGNNYMGNNYNANNYTGNNYNENNYSGNNNTENNYNSNYQQYPYNNYNYNGNYQVPYQQNSPLDLEEPMKMGEWLVSLLITLVPCIGLIMIFVWAFGSTEKKSKSNFFKAYLVFGVIRIAILLIYVFFYAAYGATYGPY